MCSSPGWWVVADGGGWCAVTCENIGQHLTNCDWGHNGIIITTQQQLINEIDISISGKTLTPEQSGKTLTLQQEGKH